jgi:ABC-2 type transport system permease protein
MLEVNYWGTFKMLWRIQSVNYIKGKINIVLGIIVTLATLFAWLSFKEISIGEHQTIVGYDPFVVASGIGVTTIRICMYNMYRNIYMFRKANVFQRLFSTPISKSFVFFSIVIFNWIVNLGVCAGLFGFSMIFSAERARLATVDWATVFCGFFLLSIFCSLFAFLLGFGIGFTQKKFEVSLVIASLFYFGAIYILGLGIPYSLVFSKDVSSKWFSQFVYWADYFLVVKYPLNIMQAGWSKDLFTGHSQVFWTTDIFGYGGHEWVPYVVSVLVIILTAYGVAVVFVRNYAIGLKKYRRVQFSRMHSENMARIKKASSVEELEIIMKKINSQRISIDQLGVRKKRTRRAK